MGLFSGDRGIRSSGGCCEDASAALMSDCYERPPSRNGCSSRDCQSYPCQQFDNNDSYYGSNRMVGSCGSGRGMGMAPMMLSGFMNPYGGCAGGGGFGGGLLGGMIGGFMGGGMRGGFGGGRMAGGFLGGILGGLIQRVISRFRGGGNDGGCDDGGGDDGGCDDGGGDDGGCDDGTCGPQANDNRDLDWQKERRRRDEFDQGQLEFQTGRKRRQDSDQALLDSEMERRRRYDEDRARLDEPNKPLDDPNKPQSQAETVVDGVRGVSEKDKERAKDMTGFEEESLRLINKFRGEHGLAAVKFDPRLQLIALVHSKYQDENGLGHNENRSGWVSPKQRMNQVGLNGWAENAAYGSITTPKQLVDMWIKSAGHRAALLDRNVKIAGISKVGRGATLDMV